MSAARKRRVALATLLIWIIAFGLLVWVLRSVPLDAVGAALARLTGWQIAILLLGNVVAVLIFPARWWIILRRQGYRVPYFTLASYRLAAAGVSYFTPGSQFGGEPLQIYLLTARQRVPGAIATASVATDKLIELMVNLTVVSAGLLITLHHMQAQGRGGLLALAALIALLLVPVTMLASLHAGQRPITRLFNHLPAWAGRGDRMHRLRALALATEDQMMAMVRQDPRTLILATLVSLASWAAIMAEVWLAIYFLGTRFNLVELIASLTASRIAILLPSPGGLGTIEASQVWMFRALGYDPALGLSLSLIVRMRDVLFAGIGLCWGAIAAGRSMRVRSAPTDSEAPAGE